MSFYRSSCEFTVTQCAHNASVISVAKAGTWPFTSGGGGACGGGGMSHTLSIRLLDIVLHLAHYKHCARLGDF